MLLFFEANIEDNDDLNHKIIDIINFNWFK